MVSISRGNHASEFAKGVIQRVLTIVGAQRRRMVEALMRPDLDGQNVLVGTEPLQTFGIIGDSAAVIPVSVVLRPPSQEAIEASGSISGSR